MVSPRPRRADPQRDFPGILPWTIEDRNSELLRANARTRERKNARTRERANARTRERANARTRERPCHILRPGVYFASQKLFRRTELCRRRGEVGSVWTSACNAFNAFWIVPRPSLPSCRI